MKLSRLLLAWVVVAAVVAAGCGKSAIVKPVPVVPLDSLTLVPPDDTVRVFVGDHALFGVVAVDTGGVIVSKVPLKWHSTNSAVFTVSSSGLVTGIAEGVDTLTVSSGGRADTALIIVLPRATGWFSQPTQFAIDLNSVFFLPDGNSGWAVGATGSILSTTSAGQSWSRQLSPATTTLNSVWFTTPDTGWAVGAAGTVLRTGNSGASWSRITVPASEDLYGVTFATPDTGWIVGGAGVVLRTVDAGRNWVKTYPTQQTMRAVSFAGTRYGWAVGDAGTIVGTTDRGLSWDIVQPAVTAQRLRSIWRRSPARATAVGDQGAAPRTDPLAGPVTGTWEIRNAGSLNQLYGVCFVSDSTGFAVGHSSVGIALRTDDGGISWAAQVTGTQFHLNGVHFIDRTRGWAVGDNGVVLHTVTGGKP
jgi:photosystem II stability/assembly factor-like uncharacterized protein